MLRVSPAQIIEFLLPPFVVLFSYPRTRRMGGPSRGLSTSCAGLFPWLTVRCYCKRPSFAASAYPSLQCIVSNRSSKWKLLCEFVIRPGHSFVDDKWSSQHVLLATSSLTNPFVRSPTNALRLSDWNLIGHPCFAIKTFIK